LVAVIKLQFLSFVGYFLLDQYKGRMKNRILKENRNEAYISAKPFEARAQARIPCSYVDPRGQGHNQGPPGKGQASPVCLTPDRQRPRLNPDRIMQ